MGREVCRWPGECPAAPVLSSDPHMALQETEQLNLARGARLGEG